MGKFIIKKIMVPVDFSATGQKVLEQVAVMAKKNEAEVVLFISLEGPVGSTGPDYFGVSITDPTKFEALMKNWANKNMEKLEDKLKKAGVKKVSHKVDKGTPYKMIVKAAKDIKADIIVMGTHGVSGFREFAVGSNTARVVSEAPCPVLSIQKHSKKGGFTKILVPFRDKPHARESVDYAIDLAKTYGATMQILGISVDPDNAAKRKIQLEADQIRKISEKRGVKTTVDVVKGRYVPENILDYATKKKSDLVVLMADLDKSGISEYIMGPVIQRVVNHSKLPILSIHPLNNPKLLVGGADWTFWA